MSVKQIYLKNQLPKDQWKNLLGTHLTDKDYDEVIDYDCDVFTPEGDILLRFRKNRIDLRTAKPAWEEWRKLNTKAHNRGMATGKGTRYRSKNKRWTAVRSDLAPITNIVGYFDRQDVNLVSYPYCRQTAFTAKNPEAWSRCLPFIRSVDQVYRKEAPVEYAKHREVVDRTSKDFMIADTVYTTITVNKNWKTAVHEDKGDLKGVLSCITALRAGKYEGGYTCFPHYRVAVDLQTCDLMMFNSHHMHGNTPIRGKVNEWERVSLVLYYREKMMECGTAEEELARAKEFHEKKVSRLV